MQCGVLPVKDGIAFKAVLFVHQVAVLESPHSLTLALPRSTAVAKTLDCNGPRVFNLSTLFQLGRVWLATVAVSNRCDASFVWESVAS
jgi:hypothetical protein